MALITLSWYMCFKQLSVKGYNDKQHVMLQKLMDKITSFDIDPKRFDILLEKVNYIVHLYLTFISEY